MRMRFVAPAVIVAAALVAACSDEDTRTITEVVTVTNTVRDTVRIGNTAVTFDQIERLGNPLVSEVFVEKREHGHFNTSTPEEDVAQFRDDIVRFITTVAGRDGAYATAVATALTPDMLVVRTDKAPGVAGAGVTGAATVGWLTQVLDAANGYGGRKLDNDDATDKGLAVTFGNALGNNANVSPGLVTDNVPDSRADGTTFPYIAPAN